MSKLEAITVEHDGPVAVITLCRPEVLNALNSTLQHELYTTFQELDADAQTNAIVVTGSGDRAFSAGADIKEMARLQQEGGSSPSARHTEDAWDLANARKPTIGALNGLAYGGGAVLASSFDIRVGCPRTKFRFLAVSYGRINSTWLLPEIVGRPDALDLLMTARVVEAEEAYRIGLLNRLVEPEEVLPEALRIGHAIAANDPRMVQAAKQLVNHAPGGTRRQWHDAERDAMRGDNVPTPVTEAFSDFLARKGF